jgi:uncharacterized repeat protein (TIGR02543 family)
MKKIYVLIAFALLAVGQVWAETARISNREWADDNRSWSGNFVTFTLNGDGTNYYNAAVESNAYLTITGGNEYTISWNVSECHDINVTSLDIRLGHNGMVSVFKWEDCDIYVNGALVETIGTTTGSEKSYSGYSLGNNDHFTLKTSRDINIYWLQITYTMGSNTYTVAFHADDATSGEMANQNFTYDVAQNLSANAFVRAYTVNYDVDGGECAETSAVADYAFAGWATDAEGAAVYANGQNVSNLTKVDGAVIDLYAKWNSASVILPEATKEGFLFNGWYNGEAYVGKVGDIITPEADITLTAHWADQLTPQFSLDKTEIELDQMAILTLTNVDEPAITFAPEGIVDYNAETGVLVGVALGEVSITISQEEKGFIAAKEETLKLNVVKKTPSLAVRINDAERTDYILNPGLSATLAFNKVSDAEVEVSVVSGEEFVSLNEGILTASMNEGTTAFLASLAETETYKGTSVEFSVQVVRAAEATDCYVLANQSDEQSVWHGETCHEHTWSDENAAGVVRFQIDHVTASIDAGYKVQQLLNGEWQDVTEKKSDHGTSYSWREETLNPAAKGVRVWGSGSLYNHVKNISVSRLLYLKAEDVAMEAEVDKQPCKGTLKVEYSIANGGDLKIVCDNEKFELESYVIENVDCKTGVANIEVSYSSESEIEDEANVIIYNAVYRKELKLTAKVTPSTTTYGEYTAYFCEGESVEFLDQVYDEATVEPIQVLFGEKNILGGDSIIFLTVIEIKHDTTTLNEKMEIGSVLELEADTWFVMEDGVILDEVMPVQTYLSEEAEYVIAAIFKDEHDCDSVVVRHITVVEKGGILTGVQNVKDEAVQTTKFISNGVLYIRRGEALYTIEGKRVK